MDLGKLLIICGMVLVIVGLAVIFLSRARLPLGRLPGDFLYRSKNTTVYFPLATSFLLSVILSVVLYVIRRWRR